MYSEKLERLIQLSIEDGEVDDASWAILLKKANEEGVDPDELTLYVNSLLKKLNRTKSTEMTEKVQVYEKAKKEAIGNICPKCGQQVPTMSVVCPYCGCEIVKKKGVSSAEELLQKIETISQEDRASIEKDSNKVRRVEDIFSSFLLSKFFGNKKSDKEPKEQRIANTITLFPVPNTKEDIIEFLSIANAQSSVEIKFINTLLGRIFILLVGTILLCLCCAKGEKYYGFSQFFILIGIPIICIGSYFISLTKDVIASRKAKVIKEAWHTKRKQLLLKGRSITGDIDFQKKLDYYEKIIKDENRKKWVVNTTIVLIILVLSYFLKSQFL